MLAQFRAFAKTPFATVLLVVLAASLGGFGVSALFRNAGGFGGNRDIVVQAGGHVVDSARFKRTFDGYLDQLRAQAAQQGQPQEISVQEALNADVDHRLAEQMGDDAAFSEMIDRLGVRASDRQVLDQIRKVPAFFDPVSGRFDKKVYDQRLAQVGLTEKAFEDGLRDEAVQQNFVASMVGGLRAPRVFAAAELAFNGEGRSFSYFVLSPDKVQQQGKPTDAQLLAFMQSHAAQLTRPAMRQLSAVHFSTAVLAPTLPVDPAQVQKRFDFEKDSLSTPERRSLFQIAVRTQPAATAAAARLKAGEDPATVAKAVGGQLIPYVSQPQSAIGDRKVADAASKMHVAETAAVQGDLGWAALRLTAIMPGHVATLDEARPKIEAEVRQDAARAKVDAQVSKFEDVRNGGAGVVAAAKQVGAPTPTLGPVTAQGADGKGQPSQIPPQVLKAAFALPANGDSDVVDLKNGEYWALHLDRVLPPALVSLNDFRPQITRAYVVSDVVKRMKDKADGLADQVRHNGNLAAAAASIGAPVQNATSVTRAQAGQTWSRDLIGKLFDAKPGEVLTAENVQLGYVVAKLDLISPPAPATAAPQLEAQRRGTTRALFESLGASVRLYARQTIKPRIDEKRARHAVGGDVQGGPAR